MGNISNICCQGPTNISANNLDFTGLAFEPCSVPQMDPNVKQKLSGLTLSSFDLVQEKYKELKKHTARELTKNFVYDGTWSNDMPEGYGKIFFQNGDHYQGQFKDGKAQGQGRFIFVTGEYFEGSVKNNRAEGKGNYYGRQIQYSGQWQNSKPTVGSYKFKKTNTIVLKNYENQGQIQWINNNKYIGQIKDFLPYGNGRMEFQNGNIYDGEWKEGTFDGQGLFKWTNGKSYKGQYVKGQRQGNGQFNYSNNRRYVGLWKDGKQNGYGKLFQNNQIVYEGDFINGIPKISTQLPQKSSLKLQSQIGPTQKSLLKEQPKRLNHSNDEFYNSYEKK